MESKIAIKVNWRPFDFVWRRKRRQCQTSNKISHENRAICIVLQNELLLENIFAFLDLPALIVASRVCWAWSHTRCASFELNYISIFESNPVSTVQFASLYHCSWPLIDLRGKRVSVKGLRSLLAQKQPECLLMSRCKVDFELLAPTLISGSSIQELELRSCYLQANDIEHIALGLLSTHNRIRSLDLSGNRLLPEGATALANGLSHNTSLQYLNLSGCYPAPHGLCEIITALFHHPRLTTLKVCFNGACTSAVVVAIAQFINTCQVLKELDLTGTLFDYGIDFSPVHAALKQTKSLAVLNLSKTGLCRYLQDLAYIFQDNKSIQALFLNKNGLSDTAGPYLSQMLKLLHYFGFVFQQFRCLAEGLQKNTGLHHLDVAQNGISHLGIQSMTQLLYEQTLLTLKSLDFSYNDINECGAYHLAHWLSTNSSELQAIKLVDCNISSKGLSALFDSMSLSKSLSIVDVSFNRVDYQIVRSLLDLLLSPCPVRKFALKANTSLLVAKHHCLPAARIREAIGRKSSLQQFIISEHLLDEPFQLASTTKCDIIPS
eukprot:gene3576-6183_t